MSRFRNKLTPQHQAFVNKYVQSRYNPLGLYKRAYFCEDENIAFVLRVEDYEDFNEYTDDDDEMLPDIWGCVNMAHQLLVPFEYARIMNFGHFLICEDEDGDYYIYNKKGQQLFELWKLLKTPHKEYYLLYDKEFNDDADDEIEWFRLCICKRAISKSLYQTFYVMENGLAYAKNKEGKVGVILFSKLKLPFEYYAIAIPQNGFTLGIIKCGESDGEPLYDCQLIKVKSQIKAEGSIHPTGINLFTQKTIDEVKHYFKDYETFEKECNSIVCYNQEVHFSISQLKFFPFDTENVGEEEYEEVEEDDDYNEWEHYSHKDALYDALGGEMDAVWNID